MVLFLLGFANDLWYEFLNVHLQFFVIFYLAVKQQEVYFLAELIPIHVHPTHKRKEWHPDIIQVHVDVCILLRKIAAISEWGSLDPHLQLGG